MMFILKRDDGAYVAKPGERSYTKDLKHARVWTSRDAAERERCSNEAMTTVEAEMGLP